MAFFISFNGEPQAEANSGNDGCGLPVKSPSTRFQRPSADSSTCLFQGLTEHSTCSCPYFFTVFTHKRFPMRLVKTTLCSLLLSYIVTGAVGCGGTTDPAEGIEPAKMAPAAEKLGEDPEYAKQFGGGKK
jgi:hypothetical protein